MSMYNQVLDQQGTSQGTATKEFFANVYAYMFGALMVTGIVAWYCSTNTAVYNLMVGERGFSAMGYVILFAPVGIALWMNAGANRLSISALLGLFLLYSVLLGMGLSFIFYIYTLPSIFVTFLTTAGTFGAMAVLGYTTKTDLTKFGGFMSMIFIGMFISSMVNLFMQSEGLSYLISFLGLFVFTGLTAYYMQNLKNMASQATSREMKSKMAILGGFTLYVLFINLFMSILRFMGDRR